MANKEAYFRRDWDDGGDFYARGATVLLDEETYDAAIAGGYAVPGAPFDAGAAGDLAGVLTIEFEGGSGTDTTLEYHAAGVLKVEGGVIPKENRANDFSAQPQRFDQIELGHASDTSITRSAAGVLAVEGGIIPQPNRANTFSDDQTIATATPSFWTTDTGAGSNTGKWRDVVAGGVRAPFRTYDDALFSNEDPMLINRTNHEVTKITFAGDWFSFVGGGITSGAPTGGNKGAGTVNANALYDDNSLVSCYPLTAAIRRLAGETDPAKLVTVEDWDAKVPDRLIPGKEAEAHFVPATETVTVEEVTIELRDGAPVRVVREVERERQIVDMLPLVDEASAPVLERVPLTDEKGERVTEDDPDRPGERRAILVERPVLHPVPRMVEVTTDAVPDRVEPRIHDGARKFLARLGTEHDPLQLDGYAAHWKTKRHLTSLPNEETYDPENGLSTGEWVQRLVETVEIQAVLIEALNARTKEQDARIAAIEASR
jgi:hypothetical protein